MHPWAHGVRPSMNGRKVPRDNAVAETFFSTLKNELVHHHDFHSRDEARSAIFEYIELFYGSHSARNIPEITPKPEDFVSSRYHGMSPFTGTSLDMALRNMGIKTVIATGVSLNVGIFAMVCEAVGL